MNAAVCARVMLDCGQNCVGVQPVITPASASARISGMKRLVAASAKNGSGPRDAHHRPSPCTAPRHPGTSPELRPCTPAGIVPEEGISNLKDTRPLRIDASVGAMGSQNVDSRGKPLTIEIELDSSRPRAAGPHQAGNRARLDRSLGPRMPRRRHCRGASEHGSERSRGRRPRRPPLRLRPPARCSGRGRSVAAAMVPRWRDMATPPAPSGHGSLRASLLPLHKARTFAARHGEPAPATPSGARLRRGGGTM